MRPLLMVCFTLNSTVIGVQRNTQRHAATQRGTESRQSETSERDRLSAHQQQVNDIGAPSASNSVSTTTPTFFVSSEGDDASAGSEDQPFRTLHHAQVVARRQSRRSSTAVRALIYLRAGVFLGPENIPLRFTSEDSGTVWEAYHGEEVLLSGGVNVDKALRPHPTMPGVLQANLTRLGITHAALGQVGGNESTGMSLDRSGRYGEVGAFAELFYDSQAMVLAQWPNRLPGDIVNYSHTAGPSGSNCTLQGFSCSGNCTGFKMDGIPDAQLQRWAREASERDPWLHGFPEWDFSDEYIKLRAVDATNGGLLVDAGHEVCKAGARITVTNMLSELDIEHEYYIERSNGSKTAAEARGTLLFRRPAGAAATTGVPSIRGAFVSLTPSVISFADNTSMITVRGVRLEHSRGSAVAANGISSNITIQRCVVANTGASGIEMTDCTGCVVADSEVYGVAGYGINIAGGRHDTLRRGDNIVRNTSIYRYARWHRTNRPGKLILIGRFITHVSCAICLAARAALRTASGRFTTRCFSHRYSLARCWQYVL